MPIVAATQEAQDSLLRGDPTFDQNGAQYHHRSVSQSGDYGAEYGQAYPQGSLTQAPYAQPTYAGNASLHQDPDTVGAAGSTGKKFAFLKGRWPTAFLAITGIQALINLAFEAYVDQHTPFPFFFFSCHSNAPDTKTLTAMFSANFS